jgi:hypothetical protein
LKPEVSGEVVGIDFVREYAEEDSKDRAKGSPTG